MTDNLPYDKEIRAAIARNLLLKYKLLMAIFSLVLIIQLVAYAMAKAGYIALADNLDLDKFLMVPAFIALIVLDEVFAVIWLKRIVRGDKQLTRHIGYLISVLEISFPTILMAYMCYIAPDVSIINTADALSSPPLLVYFVFIILSSLNLDFVLSVVLGAMASVQYLILNLIFIDVSSVAFPSNLAKAGFLLIGGVLAGLVSLKIRDSLLSSVEAKNNLITTLDKKVKEATKELTRQRDQLEEHNKNITDSINYAYRIQRAILPPDHVVKEWLPQSFVLYKPKDVVSGDFYYVGQQGKEVVFSAVDCTGHGVPGAMLSVVGFKLIQEAVAEKGITKPSDILHYLDHGVSKTLRQSNEAGIKDGMDLGLCSLDPETRKIQYAGAYNPIYFVKDGELNEIKADKFPIGVNLDGVADQYTNHEVQLNAGDTIYLLSDGFADQFGGPKGKKFKYQALKDLILSIQDKDMDTQKELLEKAFNEWQGDLEQVDDVCLIGVRV